MQGGYCCIASAPSPTCHRCRKARDTPPPFPPPPHWPSAFRSQYASPIFFPVHCSTAELYLIFSGFTSHNKREGRVSAVTPPNNFFGSAGKNSEGRFHDFCVFRRFFVHQVTYLPACSLLLCRQSHPHRPNCCFNVLYGYLFRNLIFCGCCCAAGVVIPSLHLYGGVNVQQ